MAALSSALLPSLRWDDDSVSVLEQGGVGAMVVQERPGFPGGGCSGMEGLLEAVLSKVLLVGLTMF